MILRLVDGIDVPADANAALGHESLQSIWKTCFNFWPTRPEIGSGTSPSFLSMRGYISRSRVFRQLKNAHGNCRTT
jgi:hypothetical protein